MLFYGRDALPATQPTVSNHVILLLLHAHFVRNVYLKKNKYYVIIAVIKSYKIFGRGHYFTNVVVQSTHDETITAMAH